MSGSVIPEKCRRFRAIQVCTRHKTLSESKLWANQYAMLPLAPGNTFGNEMYGGRFTPKWAFASLVESNGTTFQHDRSQVSHFQLFNSIFSSFNITDRARNNTKSQRYKLLDSTIDQ